MHFLKVFDNLYEMEVAMETRKISKRKFKKLAAVGGSSLGFTSLSLHQPSKAVRFCIASGRMEPNIPGGKTMGRGPIIY
jgi:hypothetical protein